MKTLRQIGSLAFVLGLFTVVFAGIPWYVIVADPNVPVVPWWLRIAVFCLLGGILVVLLTLALEQMRNKTSGEAPLPTEADSTVLLLNSADTTWPRDHGDSRSRPGPYGICHLAWQRPIRHGQVDPWRRIDGIHGDDGKGSGSSYRQDDRPGCRDGGGCDHQCSLYDHECRGHCGRTVRLRHGGQAQRIDHAGSRNALIPQPLLTYLHIWLNLQIYPADTRD